MTAAALMLLCGCAGGSAGGPDGAGSPPYTKGDEPLFTTEASGGRYIGPGGQDVVTAPDGTDRLVFHSWYGGITYRGINVLDLAWEDGRPAVRSDAPPPR